MDGSRKLDIVLRLLKGESIDSLSREYGIESYLIDQWKEAALKALTEGLKEGDRKVVPAVDLEMAKKKIGQMSMDIELLLERCRKQEAFQKQIVYWGYTPSMALVGEPETHGVVERFSR